MKFRSLGALTGFALCLFASMGVGQSLSWFPAYSVYRFPAWVPLNLSLIDAEIARANQARGRSPLVLLLGDSVTHGDGYGEPSETLGALIKKNKPAANLTSPSLAYATTLDLLRHVEKLPGDSKIFLQLNVKWIAQEWTPEKFDVLRRDLSDEQKSSRGGISRVQAVKGKGMDLFVLRSLREKLKFRLINFSLQSWISDDFKSDFKSLWYPEFRQETKPTYDIKDWRILTEDEKKLDRQFYSVTPKQIDACEPLSALLSELAPLKSRVVIWVNPINPEWAKGLGVGADVAAAHQHLLERVHSFGLKTIDLPLTSKDYRDDLHLSVDGAHKMSDAINQTLDSL